MTSKAEKRARRRQQAPAETHAADETYRPKDAPGVVIKREMISEVGGGHAKVKRYRNIGASPLALAYNRGALICDAERAWRADPRKNVCPAILAEDRRECGEKFERLWYERMGVSHSDSTIPRVSSGGYRSMTEVQEEAAQEIAKLRNRMASRNYLIIENLCGFGYTPVDALRKSGVQCHPVGTAYRLREALDDLVCALTGRQIVPILVPGVGKSSKPG